MHFFVSILQWLARILLGTHFAEEQSLSRHGTPEALMLGCGSADDHWPSVGWKKIHLKLEEFAGLPRVCRAPVRVPHPFGANPRKNSIDPAGFSPETPPTSYLQNGFSPHENSWDSWR
jgi:hypothetical protein